MWHQGARVPNHLHSPIPIKYKLFYKHYGFQLLLVICNVKILQSTTALSLSLSPVPCLSGHALMHVPGEFYGDPILDTKASNEGLSQRIKKTEWKHASVYVQKHVSSKLAFQVNERCKRSVYHWISDKNVLMHKAVIFPIHFC